jgi:hypothetical protein
MVVFVYPGQHIPRFFQDSPLSRAECEKLFIDTIIRDFPSWRFDADATTTPIDPNVLTFEPGSDDCQGCFSYTAIIAISGSRQIVAQYRKNTERVPTQILQQALVSYKSWIPPTIVYDEPDWQLLFAPYAGISFARQQPGYSSEQRIRAVECFAHFIADGCSTAKPSSPDINCQIRAKLSMWATWNLEPRFSSIIQALLSSLGASLILMYLINQRTSWNLFHWFSLMAT